MKNIRFLILVFLLSLTATQGFGQIDMPRKYLYPIDTITRPYSGEPTCKDSLWYVYSDRAINPVYEEPDASSKVKFNAGFLRELVVIGKKEEESGTITVRKKTGGEIREVKIPDFLKYFKDIVYKRKIKY